MTGVAISSIHTTIDGVTIGIGAAAVRSNGLVHTEHSTTSGETATSDAVSLAPPIPTSASTRRHEALRARALARLDEVTTALEAEAADWRVGRARLARRIERLLLCKRRKALR